MSDEELTKIREYIIDNIILNDYIMFNDCCRGRDDKDVDLVEVIASLYEVLHREVTGEEYSYMFHWANKIGAAVYDDLFLNKSEDE